MKTKSILIALALATAFGTTACTTTNPPPGTAMDKRPQIHAAVETSMTRLYSQVRGSQELVAKSRAVLVFPSVLAAGLGVGGEYGEGEMLVNGHGDGYYKTVSASIGLQAGAQTKAVYFIFMTQDALDKFRATDGWTAGADASVALLKVGANGDIDSNSIRAPIDVVVLTNNGLMVNATIEGTKVSRLGA